MYICVEGCVRGKNMYLEPLSGRSPFLPSPTAQPQTVIVTESLTVIEEAHRVEPRVQLGGADLQHTGEITPGNASVS